MYKRQALLSSSSSSPNDNPLPALAIIDVRDSDYIGGHIATSTHVPSSTLDYNIPSLVRQLREKDVVVFHCMLSQQRGPGAALRYVRERERVVGKSSVGIGGENEDSGPGVKGDEKGEDEVGEREKVRRQRIYVLQGGFQAWQQA